MQQRAQSAAEELANSVSHGLGCVLALASAPVLIVMTARHGSTASIVGACVFATTMVLLYLSSTLYHAVSPARPR
ncbi:MAG TPA: hemolysin III family protein, partial [Zoogloea sp.]|nr:hemolysin III family protein [Zoogloea sp.]